MSTQEFPTPEQVREARRTAFKDATGYMQPERQKRLVSSYERQDSNRERNLHKFVSGICGDSNS